MVMWHNDCDNPPNKSLVEEKYAARRGRRRPMTGNFESAPTGGHCRRQDISTATLFDDMVGGSPEIDVKIQNTQCTALLDTGSQITTVSNHLHQNNLSHISLQNCQNLLRLEGVGGDVLPISRIYSM